MKASPWRDRKLLPSQPVLCTTESYTSKAGSAQQNLQQLSDGKGWTSAAFCKRHQLSASTQFLLVHGTSNLGKKGYRMAYPY